MFPVQFQILDAIGIAWGMSECHSERHTRAECLPTDEEASPIRECVFFCRMAEDLRVVTSHSIAGSLPSLMALPY